MGAVPSALALAFLAVGCGSGDEPAPISRSAFVEKGSTICVATRQGIRSDFETFTKGKGGREIERAEKANEMTPEEAAAQVGEEIIVPAMRKELEEFRALGVPPEDDDKVAALLNALQEGVEKAEKHPERAATDGTEAFGNSREVADDYGLEGC